MNKDQRDRLKRLKQLVDEQAEDEGLWFVTQSVSETYLQQELRKLHASIECILDNQIVEEAVRLWKAGGIFFEGVDTPWPIIKTMVINNYEE